MLADKIKNGIELTEGELRSLVFEYWSCVEPIQKITSIPGEDHRWQKEMQTILNVDGELYAIDWMAALTECQENDFWKQPYRVQERIRIIEQKEYIKI